MARRPRSVRPAPPVEVIAPAAVAEPAPPEGLKITSLDVERARRRRRVGKTAPPSPFDIPADLHPPAATPKIGHNSIAMDADISSVMSWANQNALYSMFAEGQVFLGYPYLSSLAQRPEYRVISETIANEMTREWIELKSVASDDDKTAKIRKINDEMKRLKIRNIFRRAAAGDGYFGRHHIHINVKVNGHEADQGELSTSIGDGRDWISRLKVDKGTKISFRSVEAMWANPMRYNATDPLADDWYQPEHWYVMGKELHRSRLLTLICREVPDLLKPAYSFGGLSLSQMVKPYVDNWLRTRQSVSDLVHNFSVLGLKTKLGTTLMPGGQELDNRVDLFNAQRDNQGLLLIDQSEELFNVQTSLATLDALQAQAQEQICSVAHTPVIILLGLSPHGLNASSEGEIRAYYAWVKSSQENLFRDPLETVIGFIQLSLFGECDPDIVFEFKDLWQMDAAGKAAVQKTKADTREVDIQAGIITPEEGRTVAASDPDSQYAGLDLKNTPLPEPPGMEGLMGHNGGRPSIEGGGEEGSGGVVGGSGEAIGALAATNANQDDPGGSAAPMSNLRDFARGNRSAAGAGDLALDEKDVEIHVYLEPV